MPREMGVLNPRSALTRAKLGDKPLTIEQAHTPISFRNGHDVEAIVQTCPRGPFGDLSNKPHRTQRVLPFPLFRGDASLTRTTYETIEDLEHKPRQALC